MACDLIVLNPGRGAVVPAAPLHAGCWYLTSVLVRLVGATGLQLYGTSHANRARVRIRANDTTEPLLPTRGLGPYAAGALTSIGHDPSRRCAHSFRLTSYSINVLASSRDV
eukprot:5306224-Prymnesium_polylepis.1